jgi:RNA polymerase sigma-B factor
MSALALSERNDEERLFERYHRTGDPTARDELIRRCLPLARSLAGRYARAGESLEDLVQVANVGLIKAVDRFDPTRGIAFSSFAVPSILGELKRHFRDHGWAARVPRPLQERVLKVNTCSERLSSRLGRSPKPREVAAETGMSLDEVLEAIEAGTAFDSMSLDAPVSRGEEDDGATYADSVGTVDERLELVEYRSVVAATIRALPTREREVLVLRFAEDMTQSEIASRVGISQMHVSRLIRRSLERLQAVAAA